LWDAFVTAIYPQGNGANDLAYSTYLGGSTGGSTDLGAGVVVDGSNNIYIGGNSDSTNFPTTTGPHGPGGQHDAIVVKYTAVAAAPPPSATVTFQNGVNSYTGTEDTSVFNEEPNTSYGNSSLVEIETETSKNYGLIQFTNIFGNGADQIPLGSTITSATLQLKSVGDGDGGESAHLYRMLVPWSEADTWNSMSTSGSGIQWDDVESASAIDATVSNLNQTTHSFDVTTSVQAWSAGQTNRGWSLKQTSGANWSVRMSETGTAANRPLLTVEYTAAAPIDSDGDGLWDHEEDADTDADGDPATTPGPDTDGDTTPNYLDNDDDGDGTLTSAENADPNADGDPRDALDSDWDGQPDYLDRPTTSADGTVAAEQKISDTAGGLTAILDNTDYFGRSTASIGDLDGDGIVDIAVGAPADDDGGTGRGAVYVLFLNADGTVKAEQKISSVTGGLTGPLDDADYFGRSVAGMGDLDGDGTVDIAVGAH
ncbi:MAG: DNRLRE domain-containing protein, partial [Actinomycetia bacterium]|nr:DNRLRE domain-containing protein [Actinomycetes bacterium]